MSTILTVTVVDQLKNTKAAEVQHAAWCLTEAARQIRAGQGTVTSGTVKDHDGASAATWSLSGSASKTG